MSRLKLTLATSYYDRTIPIFDGRAPVEGCDITWIALSPEETFHRAFGYQEFDIAEVSLSSHTLTTARGDAKYIGVPAFTSRVFRHSGIYIRTDRGIKRPEDLKGKTIGMPEYQQTANVWIRGVLSDEHGVGRGDAKWRTGGLDEPGRAERTPIKLPPDVDLKPIPKDRTLSQMVESGEIDAMFSPRPPGCMERNAPNVARLFPEYVPVEEDYYKRTGIFPIMHLIGIRRELVEKHPWLPVSVYKAFLKAKEIALEELNLIGHLTVTLPWCVAELARTRKLMGQNFWNYGLEGDRHVLETFLRYSKEQGLCERDIDPKELFAPSTLDLSKN
jgi:4,5-dihydroxyphthalate decarboxylase